MSPDHLSIWNWILQNSLSFPGTRTTIIYIIVIYIIIPEVGNSTGTIENAFHVVQDFIQILLFLLNNMPKEAFLNEVMMAF